ncbi:nucleotidyltransferase domain-containing protein [Patescibacteria group bacterium]|nr:nucleotidyltransferase domain-containing protein [Patescibacteria group bacterium]
MISERDKTIILKYARKYNLTEVILFGSSIEREEVSDVDIGIKGIEPELFFDFYGELLLLLSKRVDVVNLDKKNPFNKLVEKEGIKLYG